MKSPHRPAKIRPTGTWYRSGRKMKIAGILKKLLSASGGWRKAKMKLPRDHRIKIMMKIHPIMLIVNILSLCHFDYSSHSIYST